MSSHDCLLQAAFLCAIEAFAFVYLVCTLTLCCSCFFRVLLLLCSVQLVVENVPRGRYISQLLVVLAQRVEQTQLLEWELGWLLRLLRHHGEYIREHSLSLQSVFRALQRSLLRRRRVQCCRWRHELEGSRE